MRSAPTRDGALHRLASLCALALCACHAAPSAPEEPPAASERPLPAAAEVAPGAAPTAPSAPLAAAKSPPAAEPDERRRAESALAAGDLAAARAALDALVRAPLLADCEAHLRAGRVEAALAACELALEQSPELPAALYLRGVCQVALADRSGDPELFEAALDTLTRARGCAPALIAASRVARNLGRHERALELARVGAALDGGDCAEEQAIAARAGPSESAERALALAAQARWRDLAEAPGPERDALFGEVEDALARALARTPRDPWAWRALGAAYLEAGRPADARAALENGFERLRDDGFFDLIALAARQSGGSREVVRVFDRLQARRPDLGLAWWYPALELFGAGLRREGDARERFAEAERAFRTCREKDGALAEACQRYETLCRTGIGWGWIESDDRQRAWEALRTTCEFRADGLQLAAPPGLAPAASALERLIELHLGSGELEPAARAAEFLMQSEPANAAYARRAGDLLRDLGDRWQLLARDLKLAARARMHDSFRMEQLRVEIGTSRPGDDLRGTQRERDLFWRAGEGRASGSAEAYQKALAALRHALELRPDDLALGRDAAALAVFRRTEELPWAETELLRLVGLGERLLEAEDLSEEQRFALEEAWGDVHELLGVVFLTHHAEPRAARAWFERSLAIGPVRRSEVIDHYIPRCLEAEGAQR